MQLSDLLPNRQLQGKSGVSIATGGIAGFRQEAEEEEGTPLGAPPHRVQAPSELRHTAFLIFWRHNPFVIILGENDTPKKEHVPFALRWASLALYWIWVVAPQDLSSAA